MEKVYNIYYHGEQVNTCPLTINDVNEIKRHGKFTVVHGRQGRTYSLDNVRIIERIVI